jgi:hypothetical protein
VREHTVARLARRYWRLAALPRLQGRRALLDDLIGATWPLTPGGTRWVSKTRIREYRKIIQFLPVALAEEAIADGVPVEDIVRAWADALDPQP